MTMIAGSVTDGGEWVESTSLARSIENAMVSDNLFELADDTPEIRLQRRKTFVAMSKGIIAHLASHMTITFAAGDLRTSAEPVTRVPATARAHTEGMLTLNFAAGEFRATSEPGTNVPQTSKALTGNVS